MSDYPDNWPGFAEDQDLLCPVCRHPKAHHDGNGCSRSIDPMHVPLCRDCRTLGDVVRSVDDVSDVRNA